MELILKGFSSSQKDTLIKILLLNGYKMNDDSQITKLGTTYKFLRLLDMNNEMMITNKYLKDIIGFFDEAFLKIKAITFDKEIDLSFENRVIIYGHMLNVWNEMVDKIDDRQALYEAENISMEKFTTSEK